MSKVYLVNVGANSAHSPIARSPLFEDGSFVFVPFPHPGTRGTRPYAPAALPYTRNVDPRDTHNDPDWENLTYGDNCSNPRARALRRVVTGDLLLFWGMLWSNRGSDWQSFTGERRWCLLGALMIEEILEEGQSPADASPSVRARALRNVHFYRGELDRGNRVFVGSEQFSCLFPVAVDLEVGKPSGLLYRALRTARGQKFVPGGRPSWNSSLRSCRPIWNLKDSEGRKLAEIASDRIEERTGFDLLSGI